MGSRGIYNQLQSKRIATIAGYGSIVLTTVLNLILTRIYLRTLGQDNYGLYQMIYSIAQYILVLDMGISTVMVRYLVDYNSKGDKDGAENFAFHIGLLIIGILFIIAIGCTVLNSSIEKIYANLTAEEYAISHKMFVIMAFTLCLTIIQHFLRGIINSKELFVIGNISTIAASIGKFLIVYILLNQGIGVIAIALSDLIVKIFIVLAGIYLCFFKIRFRVRPHKINFRILSGAFVLMGGMLLHSVSTFANNAIDKTILGIMMSKSDVAVYAIAMPFITVFNMLPTIFTNMFLPTAIRIKNNGASGNEYTSLIVKVGRYQFSICGLMLVGFLVCGKDFIALMYGKEVLQAWIIAIIIMIPSTIQLSEEALNGVIDANDKRLFFSSMVLGMSLLNIVLTVIMVKLWGILGAPIATSISYISYFIVARNMFARKMFGINISRMIKEIPSRTLLCLFGSAVPGIVLNLIFPGKYYLWLFLFKALSTGVVFAALMFKYGFSLDEREYLTGFVGKRVAK